MSACVPADPGRLSRPCHPEKEQPRDDRLRRHWGRKGAELSGALRPETPPDLSVPDSPCGPSGRQAFFCSSAAAALGDAPRPGARDQGTGTARANLPRGSASASAPHDRCAVRAPLRESRSAQPSQTAPGPRWPCVRQNDPCLCA